MDVDLDGNLSGLDARPKQPRPARRSHDARLVSGWWILPAALLGAAMWGLLIWWIVA